MIAVPAVDLRDGACVQLVGGDLAAERVRLPDPVAVAAAWQARGFTRLHVVDLDAATGRGTNASLVREILALPGLLVSVGGGVRDEASVEALLTAGAARVVVGTRAVEDRAWLARMVKIFPARLVVAADVRGREVVTRGWDGRSGQEVSGLLATLAGLPLAAVLVTAVHQEGRLAGPDLPLVAECAATTAHPVIASGGIATRADLRDLARAGAAEAILGMALYTGTLDPDTITQEFGA